MRASLCACLSLSVVRLSVPVCMYGCAPASVNLLARMSVNWWG